jgi:hypothetical protein
LEEFGPFRFTSLSLPSDGRPFRLFGFEPDESPVPLDANGLALGFGANGLMTGGELCVAARAVENIESMMQQTSHSSRK